MRYFAITVTAFANWLFVWQIGCFVIGVSQGDKILPRSSFEAQFGPLWWMGMSIAVIVILAVIGASPLNEWFSRLFFPMRRLVKREKERLQPLMQEIMRRYRQRTGKNKKVKLYIIDDPIPQAQALGHSTLILTQGLLASDDDQIAAVIGHELGHLYHGDSALLMAMRGINLLARIFGGIVAIFMADEPPKKRKKDDNDDSEGAISGFILMALLPFMLLAGVSKMIEGIAWFIVSLNSRRVEFRADRFSAELGYAAGLREFFEDISQIEYRPRYGFMVMYTNSHPPIANRLEQLEKFMEKKGQL
ncbi:MAG: M48 family metalloprotease [Rhodospirillaceae bacterium]|nr:M48 family metalloprotease [Rhodospirillaceae bacterium]